MERGPKHIIWVGPLLLIGAAVAAIIAAGLIGLALLILYLFLSVFS